MFDYDKKVETNIKRNEKYIVEFELWLKDKGLVNKTIKRHLDNISLYLNDYLNYYDITKMEDGIDEVYSFLNGWFIEKCLWASKNSLKETAASIKKFYECMVELGYVKEEEYKFLCNVIKDNMDIFLEQLEAFDNGTYYDMFDF